MNWVLGFAFNKDKKQVLLIRKLRGPAFNIGKLNGIGGKIERGEFAEDAMKREGFEEVGVYFDWEYCLTLKTSGGDLYVYGAATDDVNKFYKKEDEEVELYHINGRFLGSFIYDNPANNINWLIPMCLNILNKTENCKAFEVKEIYGE